MLLKYQTSMCSFLWLKMNKKQPMKQFSCPFQVTVQTLLASLRIIDSQSHASISHLTSPQSSQSEKNTKYSKYSTKSQKNPTFKTSHLLLTLIQGTSSHQKPKIVPFRVDKLRSAWARRTSWINHPGLSSWRRNGAWLTWEKMKYMVVKAKFLNRDRSQILSSGTNRSQSCFRAGCLHNSRISIRSRRVANRSKAKGWSFWHRRRTGRLMIISPRGTLVKYEAVSISIKAVKWKQIVVF